MVRGLPPMRREDIESLECLRTLLRGTKPAPEPFPEIPEELLLLAGSEEIPDGAKSTVLGVLFASAFAYAVATADTDQARAELLERTLGVRLTHALASLVLDYEARVLGQDPGAVTLADCGRTAVTVMYEVAVRDGWTERKTS
ncbi:hypothetical protein CP970_11155 [Streptomyces kanamyceticus]|uniref:Uncharacterized protein n=2 Tax=Streptomyces kanamyceticus TaxID=1967 RepID=A0A5J6G795_STRKN|nr:hypothetical protein CP970_11155 [Streptomyces kanamyceticus]